MAPDGSASAVSHSREAATPATPARRVTGAIGLPDAASERKLITSLTSPEPRAAIRRIAALRAVSGGILWRYRFQNPANSSYRAHVSTSAEPPASVSRERLIESHLPLVQRVARRFVGRGEELDDLVQVGAVGLVKAADRFEPDRGVRFATFANAVIEGEIRRHLRDRTGTLRIPRRLQQTGSDIRRCGERLSVRLGRRPTTREIAAALGTDERHVEQALAAAGARTPVPMSPGEGEYPSTSSGGAAEGSDDKLLLASSTHVLDERERRIVLLRFHADMTERDIAREVGISQALVSRLLDGALAKLRNELRSSDAAAKHGDTSPDAVISRDVRPRISHVRGPEESSTLARRQGSSTQRSSSGYSGRFLVRIPSELHEQLARAAEQDRVSLNRFVTEALAASVAEVPEDDPEGDERPPETVSTGAGQPGSRRALRVALATNLIVVVLAAITAVALLVLALERGI
jgi:RNA polymerase sigma-B factor